MRDTAFYIYNSIIVHTDYLKERNESCFLTPSLHAQFHIVYSCFEHQIVYCLLFDAKIYNMFALQWMHSLFKLNFNSLENKIYQQSDRLDKNKNTCL